MTKTTLGELIESFCGRFIPRASLPLIIETIDVICIQAFDDLRADGSRKLSADARVSYPDPEHPLTAENEDYLFLWWDAFWSWRSMLTPHDFETLNGETVVMSELNS